MSELSDLPNVGKVLEQRLIEIGISTPEQLRKIGTQATFIKIRKIDSTACLHMLYGIQGAVDGIKDTLLSDTTKKALKEFYKKLQEDSASESG